MQKNSDWEKLFEGELLRYDKLPEELKSIINKKDLLVEKNVVSFVKMLLLTKIHQASKQIQTPLITEKDVRDYIERENHNKSK